MAAIEDGPLIVVSVDTHVGPRVDEDLRSYCPSPRLAEYEAFAAQVAGFKETIAGVASYLFTHPNFSTAGHHDSSARLADYDYDGVAAGVIFHGSENFEPFPFGSFIPGDPPASLELAGVGCRIYNRWLADFVSEAPDRHIGVAYLPMWDIPAAIAELRWAHDHGLKLVNFPAMRAGEILEYNHPDWDPLWAECEERQMPLVTHVGVAGNVRYNGPEAYALKLVESGGFFSHRAVWWLIYGGVFERFPGLKLMVTETPGDWFPDLARELDGGWAMFRKEAEMNAAFLDKVPRPPSEYMRRNIFLGASFASPFEVQQAVDFGIESQLAWGSDYPHVEGTYLNPQATGIPSVTRLALRNTFCGLEPATVSRMVGGNAIEILGLDGCRLQEVANRIGAPDLDEILTPIDRDLLPAGASDHAFRSSRTGWS